MIRYEGNGHVLAYLSSGEVLELSESELRELYSLAHNYLSLNSTEPLKIKRAYNSREDVAEAYNRLRIDGETKADTIRKVMKELNITYKAVEKHLYKK